MNGKITFIVHDLSSNPIVRAYPIALALKRLNYQIEFVGFLINNDYVYAPYANLIKAKTVKINNNIISYLRGLPRILKLIDGDIIYTFKPLMTTYLVGLIKSKFGKKKILLDIEDDELYYSYPSFLSFIFHFFINGIYKPLAPLYTHFLHLFLYPVKIRTIASSRLQKRYGGELILHGPDEIKYDPTKYEKKYSRDIFNLPQDKTLLLFAGNPIYHKGINIIIQGLNQIEGDKYILVCAGPNNHEGFINAKDTLGNKCILLGNIDNSMMPHLLAAIDIVPTIQIKNKFTESQIPAKLIEAMAMEKIIIATNASDIGMLLGMDLPEKEKRGYIIDFNDINEFINLLYKITTNPSEGRERAKNAREFYINNASTKALTEKYRKILLDYN